MSNEITAATPAPKTLSQEFSNDILNHFPFPSIRATQTESLKAIQKWLHSDKKFFILEGPTGFGKSGVAIAAGSYAKTMPTFGDKMQGAYILSPQKTLTEQYMNDFAKNGLVELKGQANYFCPEFDMDCESASLVFEDMHNYTTCHGYKPAKQRFVENPLGVSNFAYYLSETTTAHQLPDRTLLVLDEGHNCEDQILGFTDTTVKQKDCDYYEAGNLPIFNEGDIDSVRNWLNDVFVPAVQVKYRKLRVEFQKARESGNNEEKSKVAKKLNNIDRFCDRIAMFTNADQPSEWFAYTDWDASKKAGIGRNGVDFRGTGDLIIKPLTARLFAEPILFSKASKILIMSATILDFKTFMRNLGIAESDAEILAVDSEFPVENRPIFFKEVGDMSYKNIQKTLPLMATEVGNLLTKYTTKKGIVFTQSYSTNKYMVNHVQTTEHSERVLTHSSEVKGSREALIENHKASTVPTVIFSPSMTEGLDLKEDLGRFGILVKVPYPALDPYVRARMQRDPDWYTWLTALKMVQASGRIVRSKTDRGHIWILDSGFRTFLNRARRILPRWWTESIIDMKKIAPTSTSTWTKQSKSAEVKDGWANEE